MVQDRAIVSGFSLNIITPREGSIPLKAPPDLKEFAFDWWKVLLMPGIWEENRVQDRAFQPRVINRGYSADLGTMLAK